MARAPSLICIIQRRRTSLDRLETLHRVDSSASGAGSLPTGRTAKVSRSRGPSNLRPDKCFAAGVVGAIVLFASCDTSKCPGSIRSFHSSGSCSPVLELKLSVPSMASSSAMCSAYILDDPDSSGYSSSEAAGFPYPTNLSFEAVGEVRLADGGEHRLPDGGYLVGSDGGPTRQIRTCRLHSDGGDGYLALCQIFDCWPDGGAQCSLVATCETTLVP